MNALTRTVARALTHAPISLREIARRSDVSHVLLAHIVNGERNATRTVAQAVARALETISTDCAKRADKVRRSLATHRGEQP